MQSADVFPAGRRLESLLVRETDAETGGLGPLFAATETRIDQAFARLDRVERRLQRLEATPSTRPLASSPTSSTWRARPDTGSRPSSGGSPRG